MEKNKLQNIENWLDERFDLTPIKKLITHKKVPIHNHSVWYYMGGISLFLFIVQVLSGLLLLMYYIPGEDNAYESVQFIVTKVDFGWLVRNIHSWSANMMVFFVFLHMFSVFFTKAFKKPRELTWVSGFLLLLLALGFGFSGYLLPWNELAFFATKVGTDIVGVVPFIGDAIKVVLRGGDDVTGATLSRFFGIHVAILPALFSVFLVIHLIFVQKQGMSEPEHFEKLDESKKKYIPFFPNFVLQDALLWIIVLIILLSLTLFFPWELGLKADALASAPIGIKPEWYFMFMFETLKLLPANILFIEGEVFGILAFGLAGVIWLFIPFINFSKKKELNNKIIRWIGIFAILYIVIFTIKGYLI
ncbi:MAG: cytochrome bc complex cytochrome b subunit [Ignavibacteriales bacterium CG18_big_fil_WC_8_21_14_2_50_31_20]|nr:MAG: cytochrome bc complex cytochrome b subunit [Ignavibacteriales bacterium CG18_big_fil_WC_8_21_14_2_50_31_20]